MDITAYGWSANREAAFESHYSNGFLPARITCTYNQFYELITPEGELLAEVAGSLKHSAKGADQLPAVGDWVAVTPLLDEEKATINFVLERDSKFSRKAVRTSEEQVIATNIDTVFIVSGLDKGRNFNLSRLERYLALASSSGTRNVLVLNKADLCPNTGEVVAQVEAMAGETPVHAVSALEGTGVDELKDYLKPGETIVMLGSSGAGKSALTNVLAGEELQWVGEIRANDGRGRHTTTHRQMLMLPCGGLIIDCPGLRELQLWGNEEELMESFEDIEKLSLACKFSDCQHQNEPGCAVKAAIEKGELEQKRYTNYLKLQGELKELVHKRRKREKKLTKFHKKVKRFKYDR